MLPAVVVVESSQVQHFEQRRNCPLLLDSVAVVVGVAVEGQCQVIRAFC